MDARLATVAAVAGLLTLAPAATAQQGEWRIGGRIIGVNTTAESEAIPDSGSSIVFSSATTLDVDATYLIGDNWATEIMLTTAQHGLEADGGSLDGIGLGWVWMAQATCTLQYHIPLWGKWSPYIGLGLGLAHLHNSDLNDTAREQGMNKLRSNPMVGLAAQVGVAYRHRQSWIFTLDMKYNGVSGDIRTDGADEETVYRLGTDFNPWIVGLGAAVRF